MRVMVFIHGNEDSEAGKLPSQKLVDDMGAFNQDLVKAGVMLAGEGLHPSSKGARIVHKRGVMTVVDGPFAEAKELVVGYWIWQVRDLDEAIAWAKRIPGGDEYDEGTIELRPIFELADFDQAMQAQAEAVPAG